MAKFRISPTPDGQDRRRGDAHIGGIMFLTYRISGLVVYIRNTVRHRAGTRGPGQNWTQKRAYAHEGRLPRSIFIELRQALR